MKKASVLFVVISQVIAISAQNNLLRGIVTYQSSGSKPVDNVEVRTFGANTSHSDNAGLFELRFATKKVGDKVRLIALKEGYEMLNNRELEEVFIRSNPDDLVRVVICKAGERAHQALQYYGIIVNNINRNYETKLNSLNDKLDQIQSVIGGDDEERGVFWNKIKELAEEK